jgi:hypothetical protein
MEHARSGPSDSSAATEHAARTIAASSLQLLAMLDVVHGWDRSDAISVGDAAGQTELLAATLNTLRPPDDEAEFERTLDTLEAVVLRAGRLARVAPAQARDDASGGAMASALRHLAAASDALRERLAQVPRRPPAGPDREEGGG